MGSDFNVYLVKWLKNESTSIAASALIADEGIKWI